MELKYQDAIELVQKHLEEGDCSSGYRDAIIDIIFILQQAQKAEESNGTT